MPLASNKIRQFELDPAELEKRIHAALGGLSDVQLSDRVTESVKDLRPGTVVQAKVDWIDERTGMVVMDVGGKSEGQIAIAEFGEKLPSPGDIFPVFYEGPRRQRHGDDLQAPRGPHARVGDGLDEVQGRRRDPGHRPAQDQGRTPRRRRRRQRVPARVQVNLRRTHDISDFLNEPIRARIIKIDPERMNIVVSRRKLLEEERQKQKEHLLSDIQEGQVRKGMVKNIADFGVFVDLGGIDGLLHITDMSWGRINHPSEMVKIEQEIEVVVLRVDQDRERIALGLKQRTASPWEGIESRYPVGTKVVGDVVNIMTYGAFVKLEDGIEGLVHISEMSWTKRINHPASSSRSATRSTSSCSSTTTRSRRSRSA
jgi:small subunit ribosomal protein S1